MVYLDNINDMSKNYFIYIHSNYNHLNEKIGTKINIKTLLPRISTSNPQYEMPEKVFYNTPTTLADEKFKNKIILSCKFKQENQPTQNVSLITQQNLFHNIKFIHKNENNNFTNPRILFIKYQNQKSELDNSNQYLFRDLKGVNINGGIYDIHNEATDFNKVDVDLNRLNFYYNIYKSYKNSDYYKFKFADFIDINYLSSNPSYQGLTYDNLKTELQSISLKNDFSNDPQINYNKKNFETLFYFSDPSNKELSGNIYNINYLNNNLITPTSPLLDNSNNILLYNQLNNITTLNLKYKDGNNNNQAIDFNKNGSNLSTDLCLNFVLVKGYNIYNPNPGPESNVGKIYLNKDFIYLNAKVLGHNNSSFYEKNNDLSSDYVYLSLGNGLTGLTQNDLLSKMKFEILKTSETTNIDNGKTIYNNVTKIYFSNNNNINSSDVSDSLKVDYLLDNNYNYDYVNINYINVQESNLKTNINIDLQNAFMNELSYNVFKSTFNNLELLNSDLSFSYFENNYNQTKTKFYLNNVLDISHSNNNSLLINNKNINVDTQKALLFGNPLSNNSIDYNFRNNYNISFDTNLYLTVKYELLFNEIQSDSLLMTLYYGNQFNLGDTVNTLLLNFYKINITSHFDPQKRDVFSNVNCVLVYHDPEKTTDPSFQYPNNNIEIRRDLDIDSLEKAIQLLPGAETATSNSVFIPAKNGSNLSRKHIEGLIGLGKKSIPKLLSIEPYDDNFRIGRDYSFINEYGEDIPCKTDEERVLDKINIFNKKAIENSNQNNRKINYANLVRSNRRNRISQECVNNLRTNRATTQLVPPSINNYYTPFTIGKWK